MITIIEDKGQKIGKHVTKHRYFKENEVDLLRIPLPAGDYILLNDKVLDVIKRKKERNIEIKKMDLLGTYNVSVDTKKDMAEVLSNIVGKEHARFRDELILAKNNNIKLIILVENEDGITRIEDVFKWRNPRLDIWKSGTELIGYYPSGRPKFNRVRAFPRATKGESLAKAMLTMQLKYGVEFRFCKTRDAGRITLEILSQEAQL